MNTATNIWGTKTVTVNLEMAISAYLDFGVTETVAPNGDKVVATSGVAVVEYNEKQMPGTGMTDDEWASL